jgi:phage shock protein A
LAAARRRQRSLIARHGAALARLELCRANGTPLAGWSTTAAKLEHFAEIVAELEDEINAQAEVQGLTGVEAMFAGWESETELDRELNELRRKAT